VTQQVLQPAHNSSTLGSLQQGQAAQAESTVTRQQSQGLQTPKMVSKLFFPKNVSYTMSCKDTLTMESQGGLSWSDK